MARSREIFAVYPLVYEEKKASEKKKKEHPGANTVTESNADGIGRTTGSCNLTLSLAGGQRNATPIPSKAKRRSADIPAGTESDFIKRPHRRPTFSVFLAYLYQLRQVT